MFKKSLSSLLLLLVPLAAYAGGFDQSLWNQLLHDHVVWIRGGVASRVDYSGFANDHEKLKRYLNAVSSVTREEFESWSRDEQLAFLINAYNAWTIELVLSHYPGIDSIRDIGFWFIQSPWEISFIALFGEKRTLDEIEHRIRQHFHDPRIHFALNCASVGCPALRPEAYTGEALDSQLADSAHRFLSDRKRNRLEGNTLMVSSIFDWYRSDFAQGWHGADTLGEFLALYKQALGLTDAQAQALKAGKMDIGFLEYDWSLNSLK